MIRKSLSRSLLTGVGALFSIVVHGADKAENPGPPYHAHVYLPPHLSQEWHALLQSYQPSWEVPDPDDLEAWRVWDAAKQAPFIARDQGLAERHGVQLREMTIGGVRVVEIAPEKVTSPSKALLYMHGGGWSSHSPESTLIDTVPMADQLGVRVFSVGYKKAPFATIYEIIEQNVTVFSGLVSEYGFEPGNIGLYGCSAGGQLSMAVANAARHRGIGVPGAAVASSPMVDFTLTADTWITLEGQDPVIAREAYVRKLLKVLGITNYADPAISPHLDPAISEGMPPTLIQTGGKEVLLSDSLLLFQALEAAGQVAKLDVYDGMPHCFPYILPESPEGIAALTKQRAWFRKHLELE